MQKDIFMCFVDYAKAFDRIEHNKMMHFLDARSLDDKDLRLIQTLYYQQYAAIRVKSKLSEMVPIKRGVLSPDLFSLYHEIIIRSLADGKWVSIGGHNIINLRYANDNVLLAHTEIDLDTLDELNVRSKHLGMEINSKKTEVMTFTKKAYIDAPQCNVYLNGKNLKQVKHFKYLGGTLSWNCRKDKEMNIRLGQTKSAF